MYINSPVKKDIWLKWDPSLLKIVVLKKFSECFPFDHQDEVINHHFIISGPLFCWKSQHNVHKSIGLNWTEMEKL